MLCVCLLLLHRVLHEAQVRSQTSYPDTWLADRRLWVFWQIMFCHRFERFIGHKPPYAPRYEDLLSYSILVQALMLAMEFLGIQQDPRIVRAAVQANTAEEMRRKEPGIVTNATYEGRCSLSRFVSARSGDWHANFTPDILDSFWNKSGGAMRCLQ